MIKAVLDTNVLAPGVVGFSNSSSTPGQLLRLWQAGAFDLVVSDHILEELARTLSAPYFQRHVGPEELTRLKKLLGRRAIRTAITTRVRGIATHPEDDLVLAAAVSAKAEYLVTGDEKLQRVGGYRNVAILSPRAFLNVLRAGPPEESQTER